MSKVLEGHDDEKQEVIGEVLRRRAMRQLDSSPEPSLTLLSSSSPSELEYLSYLGISPAAAAGGMVQCAANYLPDQLFCHLCDAKSKVLNADDDDDDDFSLGNSQLSFEVKGELRGAKCVAYRTRTSCSQFFLPCSISN